MLYFLKNKKHTAKKTLQPEEWPDYVINLEGKNFEEFIKKYPLSMVDFWAPWCAPCRKMGPRIRRLAKIYKGKIAFGKIDTSKNQDVAKKYKIMGIPHFEFFRHGKKVSSMSGVKSVGYMKEVIDNLLDD